MRSIQPLGFLFGLILLVLSSCSQEEESAVDRLVSLATQEFEGAVYWQQFDETAEGVRAMMQKECGESLDGLVYRIGTRSELSAALMRNLESQKHLLGDSMTQVENMADSMGAALVGIYDFQNDVILVGKENFAPMAAVFENEKIDTLETMTAVLIHETGHAIADRRWGLERSLSALENTNGLLGLSAVIEGNAQHLAREHAAKLGVEEGFEIFTAMIGSVPEGLEAAESLVAEASAANMSFQYYEGENFVKWVLEAKGEEVMQGLFQNPPSSPAVISHPAWYLDPSLVEKSTYDLVAITSLFEDQFKNSDRTANQAELNEPTFRSAMAPLPKEDIDTMLEIILENKMVVLMESGGQRMVALVVYDSRTVEETETVLALSRKLLELRDEAFKEGPTRITKADYSDFSYAGWEGFVAAKEVETPGGKLTAETLNMHRGTLALEVSFMNIPLEEEGLHAFLDNLNELVTNQTPK